MRFLLTIFLALLTFGCSDDSTSNNQNDANNTNNVNNANNQNNASNNQNNANNLNNQNNRNNVSDAGMNDDMVLGPGWFSAEPLSEGPRQETAVVALNEEIYVIGGFNAGVQIVSLVEVYNPQSDSWRRAADVPVPMHHANVVVLDGKIYLIGFLGSGFTADGRAFIYDPQTDQWTPGVDMPNGEERGSSAIGVIGGKVYISGGFRNGAVADFSVFDPADNSWTDLPAFPRLIDHMGFGVIDQKLVVAGGRNGSINGHYANTEVFDPVVGQWEAAPDMPTPRGGVAAAVSDGKLYVFGGEGNSASPMGVFDEVEVFDLASNTWNSLQPMQTPRHGLGAASVDGIIYLAGGATSQLFDASDVHEFYVPE